MGRNIFWVLLQCYRVLNFHPPWFINNFPESHDFRFPLFCPWCCLGLVGKAWCLLGLRGSFRRLRWSVVCLICIIICCSTIRLQFMLVLFCQQFMSSSHHDASCQKKFKEFFNPVVAYVTSCDTCF